MFVAIASILGFLTGLAVGLALPDVIHRTRNGHNVRMHPFAAVRRLDGRLLGVGSLTIALCANVVLGFLLIATRAAVQEGARGRTALIDCLVEFNTRQGEALTDRDAAIKAASSSEIRLWTKYGQLYDRAKADPKTIPDAQDTLNRAIAEHRRDLITAQTTRYANPYAAPDLCQHLADR